jgi:hypothetical protein
VGKPTRNQQMARAHEPSGPPARPPMINTAVCFVCCGNAKVSKEPEKQECALAITWAPLNMPDGSFAVVPVCMEHLPVTPANQRSLLVAQGRIA